MTRKLSPAALLLLAVLCLTSCQQRMYFPDRANTPGLTEALEGKLTLAFKPQANNSDSSRNDGSQSSFGADLAFSPVNHLGIIASYRNINRRVINEGGFYNQYGGIFYGNRWELGAGYYSTFGRVGKFEIYGGYGQGVLERGSYSTPLRDYSTRYHRFFLQPALGAGNDIFSVTGGIRLAFQKYYDFRSPNPDLRYTIMHENIRLDAGRELVGFVEPFINGEVGYKFVKFNLQVGCTGQYIGPKVSGNLPLYFSLGAVFSFAPRYLAPDSRNTRRRGS